MKTKHTSKEQMSTGREGFTEKAFIVLGARVMFSKMIMILKLVNVNPAYKERANSMLYEDLKKDVLDFLMQKCFGRKNAIKAQDLATYFNISLREINSVVRNLRKEGHLIGSSKERPYGYYLPSNESEVKDYLSAFKHELFDMLRTFNLQRRAQKIYLDNLKQIDLFPTQYDQAGQLELLIT
jgi:hypothetical protein